jgi:hypothetical protein
MRCQATQSSVAVEFARLWVVRRGDLDTPCDPRRGELGTRYDISGCCTESIARLMLTSRRQ